MKAKYSFSDNLEIISYKDSESNNSTNLHVVRYLW